MAVKLFFFVNEPQHFSILLYYYYNFSFHPSPEKFSSTSSWIQRIDVNGTHIEFTTLGRQCLVKLLRAPALPPFLPEGCPLLSGLRESRGGRLCLDLGMMAGGKTWPRLWALRRPKRRRPSIKRLRVQPRSRSYIQPSSWWMTISHGFLIISKEAKGKQWVSSNSSVLVNPCLCYEPNLFKEWVIVSVCIYRYSLEMNLGIERALSSTMQGLKTTV